MNVFKQPIPEIDRILIEHEGRVIEMKNTLLKIINRTKGRDVSDDICQIIVNICELKRLHHMFDDIFGKDIKEMESIIRMNYKD